MKFNPVWENENFWFQNYDVVRCCCNGKGMVEELWALYRINENDLLSDNPNWGTYHHFGAPHCVSLFSYCKKLLKPT
jgi:hypothetical protein